MSAFWIGIWADFFTFLQVAIGLFLIFIIMLQRGKGGGLVGALGGMGGASAFGPKADIQVLKLTIGLAIAWVVIACVGIYFNREYTLFGSTDGAKAAATAKADKEAADKAAAAKKNSKSDEGKDKAESKTPGSKDLKTPAEKETGDLKRDAKSKPAAKSDDKQNPFEDPAPEAKPDAPAAKPAAKTGGEKKAAPAPSTEKPAAAPKSE